MLHDIRRERFIRKTLRKLARQRVLMLDTPRHLPPPPWIIEYALKSEDVEIAAALATCHMRGWVEVITEAVPAVSLDSAGNLPPTGFRPTHAAPMYRLTEAGWNQIKGTHAWLIATFIVSVLALAASIAALARQ